MKKVAFAVCLCGMLTMLVWARAAVAEDKDPKEVFDALVKATEKLENYKLIFEFKEPKEDDADAGWRQCEFWYGGDGLLRIEVLDGENKSSRAAYNKEKNSEKVYAKQGRIPIAIPLSIEDERLDGFFRSDWGSDIKEMKKLTEDGEFTYEGEETIKDNKADKIQIIPKEGNYSKIILWISQEDKVLLQYEFYKEGNLTEVKTWYDYNLDAGIPAKAFKP